MNDHIILGFDLTTVYLCVNIVRVSKVHLDNLMVLVKIAEVRLPLNAGFNYLFVMIFFVQPNM